jgi:hypothetical protein
MHVYGGYASDSGHGRDDRRREMDETLVRARSSSRYAVVSDIVWRRPRERSKCENMAQ